MNKLEQIAFEKLCSHYNQLVESIGEIVYISAHDPKRLVDRVNNWGETSFKRYHREISNCIHALYTKDNE